jgi:hypothetical protein
MSVCCARVLRLLCVSRESMFLSCVVLSGCGLVVRFGGDNIYRESCCPSGRNRVRRGVVQGGRNEGETCVSTEGSQKCPGLNKLLRWYDAARRRPVRWNPTPRSPTLHDVGCHLCTYGGTVNQSSAARVQSKKKSLREVKQPCPRPSAAVRGGETRVSRARSATPQLY